MDAIRFCLPWPVVPKCPVVPVHGWRLIFSIARTALRAVLPSMLHGYGYVDLFEALSPKDVARPFRFSVIFVLGWHGP